MPRKLALVLLLATLTLLTGSFRSSFADELDKIEDKIEETSKKLDDLTKEKNDLEAKIAGLTDNLSATQEDLNFITGQIAQMEARLKEINLALEQRRLSLAQKIELRDRVVRNYYQNDLLNGLEFFLSYGFQNISQSYIAHRNITQNALTAIGNLNKEITQYETDKKEAEGIKLSLDAQKVKLASLKANIVSQQVAAEQELDSLGDEIQKVNDSLSELTSKQQDLLREKFGATSSSTTVGDSEQASAALPNPPFKPAFAFFTYGYPHRVGASQYGMYGRSKSGQNYKDIIKAYFKDVEIGGECNKDKEIPVKGYGNLKLEGTYLMGIAEMPENWGNKGGYEALKAQAVLARTYALNYTEYYWDSKAKELKKRGSKVSICTTEYCQVYNGGKKGGKWKEAVEDTCGITVKHDGKPITAWYASTAGGYTRTTEQVWGSSRPWSKGIKDAKCSGNLFDCAYDGPKYGNSPWFHKPWGKAGSGSAWMKASEVEDIFNAYLLSDKNSSYNKDLSPIDKGGWSHDKVKDKLEDLGIEPVGKVKSVSMKDDGTGYTTSVVLTSDNYASKSFDGYKFKSVFNLRAPGTLVIWTGFYDVLVED